MSDPLQIRIHGDSNLPTLIYLPGLHGDWTLVGAFRREILGNVRFIEIAYPKNLDWEIDEYAAAAIAALSHANIQDGWILAESFNSQVAWEIAKLLKHEPSFRIRGLVLAGGFVKYPVGLSLRIARRLGKLISQDTWSFGIRGFVSYTKLKHWRDEDVARELEEFAHERTDLDRRVMLKRIDLIENFDPSDIARRTTFPVFHLSGLIDPVVPWCFVRPWLRKNCPTFRESRIIPLADHNVLGSGAKQACALILRWISNTRCLRESNQINQGDKIVEGVDDDHDK